MTKTVVDIVNFNADASCLPSSIWLEALKGGTNSVICQWLSLFIKNKSRVPHENNESIRESGVVGLMMLQDIFKVVIP